jgi:hypothetical protein
VILDNYAVHKHPRVRDVKLIFMPDNLGVPG